MFTTPMFYIGLVIIALLPLTVAIVAPQKIRYKIIASVCVLAVAFALMCGMYAEKENNFDRQFYTDYVILDQYSSIDEAVKSVIAEGLKVEEQTKQANKKWEEWSKETN